jgi:hypothetical protein
MPDFAPNVTFRYRLHYNVVGRLHTMQCRMVRGIDAGTGQTEAAAYLRSLFAAMDDTLSDDLSFISAEYALTDSDLFFPATVPAAVVGLVSAATFSKQDSITHLTFSGRGAGGSKINMKLYGCQFTPDVVPAEDESDFVLTSAENANVSAAVSALNTSVGGRTVCIDNTVASFHARATVKVNDFWLRQVRKGL